VLVYCQDTDEVAATIGREWQLKRWLRQKKVALAESVNNPAGG
jgi:predicted GIY-YIG superfamily endonuclease